MKRFTVIPETNGEATRRRFGGTVLDHVTGKTIDQRKAYYGHQQRPGSRQKCPLCHMHIRGPNHKCLKVIHHGK